MLSCDTLKNLFVFLKSCIERSERSRIPIVLGVSLIIGSNRSRIRIDDTVVAEAVMGVGQIADVYFFCR